MAEDVVIDDEVIEDLENLEDNPLYEVLNADDEQGAGDEETDEVLEGLEPEEGDSPDVLRHKLETKSRILRQKGKSNQRLKDRVEELEKQLKDGSGTGLSKQDLEDVIKATQVDPNASAEEEQARVQALKDRIEEDPANMLDILSETNVGLENKIAKILRSRDEYWESRLAELKEEQGPEVPPEVQKLADLLKTKEAYKDLPEKTRIQIAKDLKPLGSRVSRRVPASSTGHRVSIDATSEQVEKKFGSELDAMGYGNEE